MIPLEIAARGKALYAMMRRATAMLFCLFFPPLYEYYGGMRMFVALGLACFVYTVAVFLRLPETKARVLGVPAMPINPNNGGRACAQGGAEASARSCGAARRATRRPGPAGRGDPR